jgi:WD40 repeat protein
VTPQHPRELFTERLNQLFAAAGTPGYELVSRQVDRQIAATTGARGARGPTPQRLSDWRTGRRIPAQFDAGFDMVLTTLIRQAKTGGAGKPTVDGLYDVRAWKRLWEVARTAEAAGTNGNGNGAVTTEPRPDEATGDDVDPASCPYRGLASYRTEHAIYFHGRGDDITKMLGAVDRAASDGGPVVLMAVSGAGKSSLLRAGLIPAVAAGRLQTAGAAKWPVHTISPTNRPTDELGTAIPELVELLGDQHPEDDPDPKWPSRVRDAVATHARAKDSPDGRVLLVIDQLEELFTLCEDDRQRHRFVAALAAATSGDDSGKPAPLVVVLALRADFHSQASNWSWLDQALQDNLQHLPLLSRTRLREAITRPARAAGLKLDKQLVDQVVDDAGMAPTTHRLSGLERSYQTSVLPLISHALRQAWLTRRNRTQLGVEDYLTVGGVRGSIIQTAERALDELDDQAQRAAGMQLLLRLTRLGEDSSQDTRDRCDKTQLIEQASDPEGTGRALETLLAARLLTTTGAGQVQIIHEALLRAWPRLRAWLDEHRGGLILLQRLEDRVTDWEERDRSPDQLLRGTQLESTQQWIDTIDPSQVSPSVRDFLTRSHTQESQRLKRERYTRFAAAAVVLIVLAAATASFSLWRVAHHREQEAVFQSIVAQADRMHTQDSSLEALLDATAYRLRPTPYLYVKLLDTQGPALSSPLRGHALGINSVTFSADGHIVASASVDHTVRLWNATDPAHPQLGGPLVGHDSDVNTVAFTPDGRTLISAGDDSEIRLWNVADPTRPTPLGDVIHMPHRINTLTVSPDGNTLAAGTRSAGTVCLWRITDPAHPVPLGPPLSAASAQDSENNDVSGLAFSSDGHTMVAGDDDGETRLWNMTDPTHPVTLGETMVNPDGVDSVALSPDGNTLATGGEDHLLRLFDITDRHHLAPLGLQSAGSGPVLSVSFSPNGHTLATGEDDHTVRLWNVSDLARPTPLGPELLGHTGPVWKVAFSPDGHTLASGSEDSTVRLWAIPTVETGHAGTVTAIAYSPDGHTLASAGDDHTVRLWNTTTAAALAPPLTAGAAVNALALSAGGHLLASASDDNNLRLYSLTDPTRPAPLGLPVPTERPMTALAVTPDGHTLAGGWNSRLIQLWKLTAPSQDIGTTAAAVPAAEFSPTQQLVSVARDDPAHGPAALAISPDGRILACAGDDFTVRLFDISNPDKPANLSGPSGLVGHIRAVTSLAFSPDGHTLASGNEDDTVRLWDITDPAHARALGQPLTENTSIVNSVAFSPDGHTLASGGKDNAVRLWDITDLEHPRSLGAPLTAHTDAVRAVAFNPDTPQLASGGRDGTVRLWSLDANQTIRRICAGSSHAVEPAQWAALFPAVPFDPPCDERGVPLPQ